MLAPEESIDEGECLFTARLCLMAPRPADAEAIASLADNPKVALNVGAMPHPYARADAIEWIERVTAAPAPCPSRAYLLRLGGPDGPVIGGAGYGSDVATGGVEIGYWIGEPFWGNGYATEAAQALVDCAFSHGVAEVGACCRITNEASRRVLVKCGFQWEGSGMRHSRTLGGMVPIDRYRLDRKAWEALKAWSTSPVPAHALRRRRRG